MNVTSRVHAAAQPVGRLHEKVRCRLGVYPHESPAAFHALAQTPLLKQISPSHTKDSGRLSQVVLKHLHRSHSSNSIPFPTQSLPRESVVMRPCYEETRGTGHCEVSMRDCTTATPSARAIPGSMGPSRENNARVHAAHPAAYQDRGRHDRSADCTLHRPSLAA